MSTTRGSWFMRDRPVVIWLGLAVLVALVHPFVDDSRWLMVHLVVLGAVTHSIMVWSVHFTDALLRSRPDLESRRRQTYRLSLLAAGTTLVLVGVPTALWPVTVVGATLVSTAVVWHACMLVVRLRKALPGRFRITVRYYILAASCLPVGALLGVLLARGQADTWHGRLLVAHTMTNLLGWVGLSILGTFVTLWPTMLRTRMADGAEQDSRRALPIVGAGLALVVAGPLADLPWLTVAGVAAYLVAVGLTVRGVLVAARRRTPTTFPTLSAGSGMVWLAIGLVVLGVVVARLAVTGGAWHDLAEHYGTLTSIFVVGFALQVLLGSLTHLIPVVLGGGPSVLRASMAPLETAGTVRVVVANLGLAVCLLPVPSLVRVVVSMLVLGALASYIPLMFKGIRAGITARRTLAESQAGAGDDAPTGMPSRTVSSATGTSAGPTTPPAKGRVPVIAPLTQRPFARSQLVAGIAVVALGAALGVGLDPAAAGLSGVGATGSGATAAGVTPTGETTRVTVTAMDMHFSPSSISVPLGNRLLIDVVNADPTNVHDLVLDTGQSSGRLGDGQRATIDAGVIGRNVDAWCSIVGHRQMGMTLSIKAIGSHEAGTNGQSHGMPMPDGSGPTTAAPGPGQTGSSPRIDLTKRPGPGFTAYDPVLAPLTGERVHRVTLTVDEVTVEVAPGVMQQRWTYNGKSPGPTLHGRVGDTFEVTLVNHGSMGHSIDFHAGENNPADVMRTVPPGGSLVYRFTARRAGIWMYHCSTMPMSAHIAAGMAGAVVIEPDGLAPVSHSYLLVQSEVYLGAGQGAPVDPAKVMAERPDAVVFNGYAAQYAARSLTAKPGERIRVWVLDAGPNRSTAFHVVGAQFDTVYKEGTYLLRDGRGPLDLPGTSTGGSQALDLAPAQGGFVELSIPAAGTYPFVSHVMVDAERGARGLIEVEP
ncbi:multicopper oxidase domain-containing protein [Intrasporangium mesophilum]